MITCCCEHDPLCHSFFFSPPPLTLNFLLYCLSSLLSLKSTPHNGASFSIFQFQAAGTHSNMIDNRVCHHAAPHPHAARLIHRGLLVPIVSCLFGCVKFLVFALLNCSCFVEIITHPASCGRSPTTTFGTHMIGLDLHSTPLHGQASLSVGASLWCLYTTCCRTVTIRALNQGTLFGSTKTQRWQTRLAR